MATLHKDALDVWSAVAPLWDQGMGDNGNLYWAVLERPSLERFLAEKKTAATEGGSVRALDIATGNGLTARFLSEYLGGGSSSSSSSSSSSTRDGDGDGDSLRVTATDGSEAMLERARQRTVDGRIVFQRLDVTQPSDFVLFETGAFDVVLMNMAIMDVPTLQPLAAALPRILAVGGVFVASLLHPVFFTSRGRRTIEIVQDYDTGSDGPDGTDSTATTLVRGYKLTQYLDVAPWKGFAVPGQQPAQYYFHRPLHELFGVFLRGGQLALDGLEEPAFGPEHAEAALSAASSKLYPQFPPVLVFRLRRIR